jgi:hypothetical protein
LYEDKDNELQNRSKRPEVERYKFVNCQMVKGNAKNKERKREKT